MGAVLDGRISVAESLFVFCASLSCAAYALDWETVQDVVKPAAMALLIASVIARESQGEVKGLVIGALVASLVGDTLLLSPTLFLPGLVAFLIAHGFYIAAFARGVGFLPSRSALAAIAGLGGCILLFVWPGLGADLRAPVVVYVMVIALMAAQASGRASVLRERAAVAVAAGALMFMISDATIALTKFSRIDWPLDQWTLPTYYLAQGLIAFFILPRTRRDSRVDAEMRRSQVAYS